VKKKLEIKFWHILIIGVVLFLCGMTLSYFIFSKEEIDIVENYNTEESNTQNVFSNSEQVKLNNIKINNEQDYTKNSDKNKINYAQLTEETYNGFSEKEFFVIQNVTQNSNQTFKIKGRVYEAVDFPTISKSEYDLLLINKSIKLFDDVFYLNKYEDFIPGYILKNSNGYGFYVTDDNKLVNFNNSSFVKGTDKYYECIVDDTVKLRMPDETEANIKINSFSLAVAENYNFMNINDIYAFEFKNGKVSKIIYLK